MSSENDRTVPVPTTGPGAPTAPIRRSATGGPADDQPTTPVPRAEGRRAQEPTPTPAAPRETPAPSTPADDDRRTPRPPLRVGTVVWGLVLAVIGAGIIAVAAGAQIDLELALIALLALAGAGLVVGSVVTGVRRRH